MRYLSVHLHNDSHGTHRVCCCAFTLPIHAGTMSPPPLKHEPHLLAGQRIALPLLPVPPSPAFSPLSHAAPSLAFSLCCVSGVLLLQLPVIYGLVLTFAEFGKMPSDKRNAAAISPEKIPIVSDGMTPQGVERSSRHKWERDGL